MRSVGHLVHRAIEEQPSAIDCQQENLMVGTHILYATRTGNELPYYKRVHLAISSRLSAVSGQLSESRRARRTRRTRKLGRAGCSLSEAGFLEF